MGVYMLLCRKVLSSRAYLKKLKKNRQDCRSKGELLKTIYPEAARAITKATYYVAIVIKNEKKHTTTRIMIII